MKRLRVALEYRCHPLWIYGEDGYVEENGVPPELAGNADLIRLLDQVQQIYDSFFVDDGIDFSYRGPSTPQEFQNFRQTVLRLYDMVSTRLGHDYRVDLELPEF